MIPDIKMYIKALKLTWLKKLYQNMQHALKQTQSKHFSYFSGQEFSEKQSLGYLECINVITAYLGAHNLSTDDDILRNIVGYIIS